VRVLVLDAGALIALDRNDRMAWAMLRAAAHDRVLVRVPAGVIGQVWRQGDRQALLARALTHTDEVPLDGHQARAAGMLCGVARTNDVIDASVALLAAGAVGAETWLLTSDSEDCRTLLDVLGAAHVHLVAV
jgi:hypothetical protein